MALLEHEGPDQILWRPVTRERCLWPAKARLPDARRLGGLGCGGVDERKMSGAALNDAGERAKGLLQCRLATSLLQTIVDGDDLGTRLDHHHRVVRQQRIVRERRADGWSGGRKREGDVRRAGRHIYIS